MAAEFSQDAVLHFLQSSGGSVRNSDLLQHFSGFLRDHAERQSNRERFKKFVNSVATVKQSDGTSYVVLRKKFRGYVAGAGTGTCTSTSTSTPNAAAADARWYKVQQTDAAGPAPPGQTLSKTILPAAGILEVRAEQQVKSAAAPAGRPAAAQGRGPSPELKISGQAAPAALQQGPKGGQQGRARSPPNGSAPVLPAAGQQREPSQQVPEPLEENLQGPLLQNLHDQSPHNPSHVSPRRHRYRQSYKTALSHDEDDEELEAVTSPQCPAGQAQRPNCTADTSRAASGSSSGLVSEPPTQAPNLSFSSSERTIPKIYVQDVEREAPNLGGLGWGLQAGPGGGRAAPRQDPASHSAWTESRRHSLPPSPHGSATPPSDESHKPGNESHQSQKSGWSSSHSSVLLSSSSNQAFSSSDGPPQGSPGAPGWRSSMEDVREAKAGESVFLADSVRAPQRAEDTHRADTSPWCHSASDLYVRHQPGACSTDDLPGRRDFRARVMPWHLSTGDLYDDRHDAESSEGSTCSPQPQPRSSAARQLSKRLRNRMCRSLGADLDQLLDDEPMGDAGEEGGGGGAVGGGGGGGGGGGSEAARRIRLHRISSSLSLRYNLSTSSLSSCSTPPRCQSLGDLAEKEGKGGLAATAAAATVGHSDNDGRGRQSLIPLEPREHAWLVKGAAGAWPDIYSLFREDSSLLNRQDFISGFTVLHWIAKHGDHRVLNTLWYGVEKAGLTFDVDARSNSGQTPLHVAAIHGNKNILRLLVTKFKASVRVRDMAGKRPWQYLSRTAPLDVFQLLGGPARAAAVAATAAEGPGGAESSWELQQRRRRRHHLSSASSAERPLKHPGGTKVKRSSSIAAFLKHKSLHRFYGHQSDSLL